MVRASSAAACLVFERLLELLDQRGLLGGGLFGRGQLCLRLRQGGIGRRDRVLERSELLGQ